jgi:hypothetical protein
VTDRLEGLRNTRLRSLQVALLEQGSNTDTKTALVSLVHPEPRAAFSGFLLKSYDLETGKYIGSFSKLPAYTELYGGCPVPEAAVHHNQEAYWDGQQDKLTVQVEWPADRELGFVCFPVRSEFEWYEVYGSTTGKQPPADLHAVALRTSIFSPRLGDSAWFYLNLAFYLPILLLVFVGTAAKEMNGPGQLGSKLNCSVPAKTAPEPLRLSLGEWLSYAVFYVVQIVVLALMTVQINNETEGKPFSKDDGVKWYPNPWDAALGRALGRLLQANMALTLLLPTRNAVWPRLVGISFERCVKYHRHIGRWTFINMVAHFVAMLLVYGKDVLMTRSGRFGEGNLYGLLAGISMALMVLSSAEPVRRYSYELFLALHMMAFPVLIFSVLHVRDTLVHLILPLLLYSADWVIRIYQWTRTASVVSVQALADGCTRLHLRCPAIAQAIYAKKADGIAAFIYLQHPGISANPLEWHPFTVSGLEWSAGPDREMSSWQGQAAAVPAREGPPDGLTVHIKSMGAGSWSERLHKAALEKQGMTIRLEGPYGHMGINLAKYSHVLNISGGIGFTPCAGLLQLVLDPARRQACLPLLRSMRVVWVVRTHAQLDWFAPLLQQARALRPSPDFRLSVDLYVTQGAAPPQPGPGSQSCRSLPPSCLTLSLSWRLFLSAAARVASWRIVFLRALCRAVCPAPSLCDQCVSVPACISRSETPPSLHVRPSTLPPPPPAPLGTFIPLAYQDDASSKSRAARVACDHGRGGDRQQRRAGGGPRLWPGRSYFRNGLALSPSVLQSLTRGASHFFSSLTGAPVLRPFLPGHA